MGVKPQFFLKEKEPLLFNFAYALGLPTDDAAMKPLSCLRAGQDERARRDPALGRTDAADAQPDVRRDPGMHKTPSTDYIILLSGTITLVLDKTEHDLQPFDAVVQRGTNHAWVNRGTEDALLMAVLVSE